MAAKKPTKKSAGKAAVVVKRNGEQAMTPGKHPLALPTQALADAVAAELQSHQAFNPHTMPLTLLAYTAIDRIAGQEAQIVEVLLAYVDTDALCYRAEEPVLAAEQKKLWDPLLNWAGDEFGASWKATSGLMPLDQPKKLHAGIGKYLASLDAMTLAACCILASGFSSLALALAVLKGKLNARDAFKLSRLEEESQAKRWGRDSEAQSRTKRLAEDITSAEEFLRLLNGR